MKIFASLMTAFLLFGACMPAARADTTVNIDYFYDALSPYGDWVEVEGYGYCFQPFVTVEDPEWRPYTDGNWAYSDAGWTWVSEEDFGWATYHYGRWMKAGTVWLWVPGDVWAPAWVSWRSSPEYVGWAPLPPEAVWQPDVGFSVAVDTTYDIGPAYYSFVAIRHFGAPRLRTYVEPWHRNVDYMRWTDNCTHITYRQSDVRVRNIFIGGPDYVEMNRYSERPFRRMTLRRDEAFDPRNRDRDRRSLRIREDGDALVVAAPSVTLADRKAPPAEKIKAKLDKASVDRGWRGIKSEDAGSVREKLKREVAEAKTRPGRGGPPDAPAGPDGVRNRERGPDSTVAPNKPGERAPKALPATPDETPRTLPGDGTPGSAERGPGMRRPGEDGSNARVPGRPGDDTSPGARGPRRPGDTNEDKKGPGRRGPDAIIPPPSPYEKERTGPGATPEMKPKDDDNRGKPDGRRGPREGEDARPDPGNTVSPVVPRPGGVPPETSRKEKVTPPMERKPDVTPGEGPDRRRAVRPDTTPNENAIPKPDRTPKPDKAERKIDRTPDTPPAPRNVAPPVAPVPMPRPEIRKPEQPREESRRRTEAKEAPRPQRIERPEPQKPQIQRPEAPRPQPPTPAAAPGGPVQKEKGAKKDDEEKEKGKRGR